VAAVARPLDLALPRAERRRAAAAVQLLLRRWHPVGVVGVVGVVARRHGMPAVSL